jgi:competence protein ComEA
VVLNRADSAELQRLPGVGVKRAEAILALRQRLGRFRRPSDLLRVKGIGPRTLERMLPHLVLD